MKGHLPSCHQRYSSALVWKAALSVCILMTSYSASADDVSFTKPLDTLTSYRERPLFAPTRRADEHVVEQIETPQISDSPALNAVLLGLISNSDGTGLALLRIENQPDTLRVHIGESVLGWQLEKLDQHQAIFSNGTQSTVLEFPKAAMTPSAQDGNQTPEDAGSAPMIPDNIPNP